MDTDRKEELDKEDKQDSSMYNDWLSDNIKWLTEEFIEEHEDDFNKFTKCEFNEYMESRI